VALTSNNDREIAARNLYCCLLTQCEALRTCRSGFPIATLSRSTKYVDVLHIIKNNFTKHYGNLRTAG